MKNYFGFPREYKVTIDGVSHIMAHIPKDDSVCDKIQQWTGATDRNGKKVYFGDTLRFVDKVEWYRSEYWAKVQLGRMTYEQAMAEIEAKLYYERTVCVSLDLDWLNGEDMKLYFEVINT